MNDPILVQPFMPLVRARRGISPDEAVESLIEDLRAEGLDARISHEKREGGEGGAPFDLVVIWVADAAGQAIVGAIILAAIRWLRSQFRQHPEEPPQPKCVDVMLYDDGDMGRKVETIVLHSADDEPVRITPEDFERYTRRKPAEAERRGRKG